MKRLALVVFTLFFSSQAILAKEYDRETLLVKRTHFSHMRTTGFVLAGLGAAMIIGGAVLAGNGEYETVQTTTGTQKNAKDGAAAGGIILLIVGIPATVAGLIVGGIGAKKTGQYDRLLEGVSVGLEYGQSREGMRLTYSF